MSQKHMKCFISRFRRLSEEARRAADRRERLRLEAEEDKRRVEEERRKRFEVERMRLMALEEEDRQLKLAEQVKEESFLMFYVTKGKRF